jgi:hypothetical protein
MKALSVVCLVLLILFCSFGLFRTAGAGDTLKIVDIVDHSFQRHCGDFNGDFIVDGKDALILEQDFGSHNVVADANGDGVVDIFDALAVSRFYGPLPMIEVHPGT